MNGVARTAWQLTEYAARNGLPLMCIRPGRECRHWQDGSIECLELRRSRLSVRVEADLWQDPAILRYLGLLHRRFRVFRPNVVHITSMGDFGLLGWMLAREFRLPLVAAWHTNVHEYAAWRFERVAAFLPPGARRSLAGMIERSALKASISFYRKGTVGLAPTGELVELLRTGTRKPAFLMERGVDTELFDPCKRRRRGNEVIFGYVGRLSSEKNLRLLKLVEDALLSAGIRNYRFDVIGHGAEGTWLQNHLQSSRLPGVLLGRELARSYADMDVFLFPSRTDTYGNVVWEASASGVPAVVTDSGGPRHIVQDRVTGLVCRSDEEFVRSAVRLYRDPDLRTFLGAMARRAALKQSWEAVFDQLYAGAYRTAVAA